MTQTATERQPDDCHVYVTAFDSACRSQGPVHLADFLPPLGHPHYLQVLRELLRRDLKFSWSLGKPKTLDEYQRGFPALFEDPEAVRELALEECRLRRLAGEEPNLADYLSRFGAQTDDVSGQAASENGASGAPAPDAGPKTVQLDVPVRAPSMANGSQAQTVQKNVFDAWRLSLAHQPEAAEGLHAFRQAEPATAARVAQAVSAIPEAGADFLGFRLLAELGRGAFGRVFLAQQTDLANRFVALKIAADLFVESQTLAQLQHTNIVPIYSIHRAGQLQAACMPFFGATTFADVVKTLEKSASLPASGKLIVSTLHQRHSDTHQSLSKPSRRAGDKATAVVGAGEAAANNFASLPALAGPRQRRTADLAQLEELSYVHAVLWVAVRLAEGLAHAHDRGIVHRDLKPANILLSDEGQPMLLDFNLSEDTKLRGSALAARMGGTLPYMSPEQLEAFQGKTQTVDNRSDIYSLGVIVYELLNGRHPFPKQTGSTDTLLPRMLEDRSQPRATVGRLNKMVSPAVSSILQHCLEVDPVKRYQSAHELAEDLERHLDNLPLRYAPEISLNERSQKWVRRHPRLTVSLLVGLAAALLIGTPSLWFVVRDHEAAQTARAGREFSQREKLVIQSLLNAENHDRHQLDEGIHRNNEVFKRYHVLDDASWRARTTVTYLPPLERDRLIDDMRLLLFLQARALTRRAEEEHDSQRRETLQRDALRFSELAERESPDGTFTRAGWLHRAELAHKMGQEEDARSFEARAAAAAIRTAQDKFDLGVDHMKTRRYRDALPLLQEATRDDPKLAWAWFCQGVCHFELGELTQAEACYNACIVLYPDSYEFYCNRGLVYRAQGLFDLACRDLDETIRLRPDLADHYVLRGIVQADRGNHKEAIQDFTSALDKGSSQTRIYFLRANALEKQGDAKSAARDRELGFAKTPSDEFSWNDRGFAKLPADPKGALLDFEEALKLNPRYFAALQCKASVYSEHMNRADDAVKVLNQLIDLYPDFVPARVGRGVILARLGKRDEAHRDAKESLDRERDLERRPTTLYQVSNIYALTSRKETEDRKLALKYFSRALNKGFRVDEADKDPDMDPVRDLPEFKHLMEAAQRLQAAGKD